MTKENFVYEKKEKTSDVQPRNCLICCNTILTFINLFISTFFISYIHKFNSNIYDYIFNVGLFEMVRYVAFILIYYISSFIVDKTNRVGVFRVSICIKMLLVISFVFYGEILAKHVFIAGIMLGLSNGLYYASYNVLKQEMVSKSKMKTFSTTMLICSKSVSIVGPILLGTLIDFTSYSIVAIIVFIVCLVQFLVSFGIKSVRPQGSNYSISNYIKKLGKNPEVKKKIQLIYVACGLYGSVTLLGTLVNVCIILEYGSNMSLGMLTSIISIVSIIALFLFNKCTKAGNRKTILVILCLILCGCSTLFAFMINKISLIIYNIGYAASIIVIEYLLDVYRNSTLKEAGLYSEISEHQTFVEVLLGISRIFCYLIMMGVGLLHNEFAFNILFIFTAIMASMIFVVFLVFEQKYISKNKIDNNEKKL